MSQTGYFQEQLPPHQQQSKNLNTEPEDLSYASDNTLTPSSSEDALPKSEKPRQPPPLEYSLHDHKRSIAITWTIIVSSSGILPILFYWVLSRATSLEMHGVVGVASAVSAVSILDFFNRLWRLLRPQPDSEDDRRPLGQGRWSWDVFQIEFAFGVVVITAIMVAGNVSGPNLHLIALPAPFMLAWVGAQMLLTAWPVAAGVRTPFPLSSVPAGAPLRPVAYTLMEDIVAVNGGGGRAYRRRLDARYQASPLFRKLVAEVSVAWGLVATVAGVVLIALIGTINVEVSYTLGWSVPWVVAGFSAWMTILWARKRLADERAWFERIEAN